VFYEVKVDDETHILMEGKASGALAKGNDGNNFLPFDAYANCIDIVRKVASSISSEVAPAMVGTGCTFEVQFAVRADGNGTVMLSQDPNNGQFQVTVKWLPFGGSGA
jgi:hypothetical protein